MKFAIKHEIKGRITYPPCAETHDLQTGGYSAVLSGERGKYQQGIGLCKNSGCRCCLYRQQRWADLFTEQIFL